MQCRPEKSFKADLEEGNEKTRYYLLTDFCDSWVFCFWYIEKVKMKKKEEEINKCKTVWKCKIKEKGTRIPNGIKFRIKDENKRIIYKGFVYL